MLLLDRGAELRDVLALRGARRRSTTFFASAPLMVLSAVFALLSLRLARITVAPSRAKAATVARPMPLLPPVTSAPSPSSPGRASALRDDLAADFAVGIFLGQYVDVPEAGQDFAGLLLGERRAIVHRRAVGVERDVDGHGLHGVLVGRGRTVEVRHGAPDRSRPTRLILYSSTLVDGR